MSVTRRVWFYLVTLVTLGIFAAGIGQLLSLLFDITIKGSYLAQVGRTGFVQQQLSLGLAMLVIGGPLWFFFWRAISRRVTGVPEETGATMRKFFLNLILLVTAITALVSASGFISWLLAGVPAATFSSGGLATLIVTGLIWYYHRRVSETEGHPSPSALTLRRWYVYILSGFGLVWLAVSLVQLINLAVLALPVWGSFVQASFWNDATRSAITWLVLGGLSWYFHWLRQARGDFDSTLRQVYFYLLAILGGAVAALVALTITFYRLFLWATGGMPAVAGGSPLQFLGWAIPTIIVGAAIWTYHQRLVQEGAGKVSEQKLSAQRVHAYLMSFLGLGTLVSGLYIIFSILLDLIINATATPAAVTAGWWRNQLSQCLALLLVGAPMWLYYWGQALRRAEASGLAEWRARSRRIFLYFVVGIFIITLAAGLVNIIYQLINGMLSGSFGINVLRNSKWSIGTLIVAAPLLWYHWQIVRGEQRRGAEAAAVHKTVTILLNPKSAALVARLEDKLGFKVRVLQKAGAENEPETVSPDEEIARLAADVQAAPSNKVLLVETGGRLIVVPYQGK